MLTLRDKDGCLWIVIPPPPFDDFGKRWRIYQLVNRQFFYYRRMRRSNVKRSGFRMATPTFEERQQIDRFMRIWDDDRSESDVYYQNTPENRLEWRREREQHTKWLYGNIRKINEQVSNHIKRGVRWTQF